MKDSNEKPQKTDSGVSKLLLGTFLIFIVFLFLHLDKESKKDNNIKILAKETENLAAEKTRTKINKQDSIQALHNTGKNIMFMGSRLDCSVTVLASRLQNKGFHRNGWVDNNYVLFGSFAGLSGCAIHITGTPLTKTVQEVMVMIPNKHSTRNSLSSILNACRKKYHIFSENKTSTDINGINIQSTNLIVDGGIIGVKYVSDNSQNSSIIIHFTDNKNSKLGNEERDKLSAKEEQKMHEKQKELEYKATKDL